MVGPAGTGESLVVRLSVPASPSRCTLSPRSRSVSVAEEDDTLVAAGKFEKERTFVEGHMFEMAHTVAKEHKFAAAEMVAMRTHLDHRRTEGHFDQVRIPAHK